MEVNPFRNTQLYVPSYGQAGGTPYNEPYTPPAPVNAPSKMDIAGIGMGAATMGVGIATGGTGWIVMGGIQLLGGLLKAFSHKEPDKTPEEIEYENMVKFYRGIGARSKAARAIVSAVTGKPVAELGHIGPDDNQTLDMTISHFDTLRAKTAAKVTGGSR